jgi:hypothetical protein
VVSQTWNYNKDSSLIVMHMDRIDIIGAVILGLKPHYELELKRCIGEIQALEPCNPIGTRYQTKLLNLTGLGDLSQETIKLYQILRHLITEKESVAGLRGLSVTEAEFHSFQLYTFQLMHRLIALAQYETPELQNRNALIYGLFGNAAMIHIMMFTWNSIEKLGYVKVISARIQRSLRLINIQAFQIAYPEMMLWVIMLGGLASTEIEDRKWFIKLLAELCLAAGIGTIAELALFLSEFLWSDFYLICPLFDEFWNDLTIWIGEGV